MLLVKCSKLIFCEVSLCRSSIVPGLAALKALHEPTPRVPIEVNVACASCATLQVNHPGSPVFFHPARSVGLTYARFQCARRWVYRTLDCVPAATPNWLQNPCEVRQNTRITRVSVSEAGLPAYNLFTTRTHRNAALPRNGDPVGRIFELTQRILRRRSARRNIYAGCKYIYLAIGASTEIARVLSLWNRMAASAVGNIRRATTLSFMPATVMNATALVHSETPQWVERAA